MCAELPCALKEKVRVGPPHPLSYQGKGGGTGQISCRLVSKTSRAMCVCAELLVTLFLSEPGPSSPVAGFVISVLLSHIHTVFPPLLL